MCCTLFEFFIGLNSQTVVGVGAHVSCDCHHRQWLIISWVASGCRGRHGWSTFVAKTKILCTLISGRVMYLALQTEAAPIRDYIRWRRKIKERRGEYIGKLQGTSHIIYWDIYGISIYTYIYMNIQNSTDIIQKSKKLYFCFQLSMRYAYSMLSFVFPLYQTHIV